MAVYKRFEDLPVWQKARKMVSEHYRISSRGELAKDYGAKDQFRRASLSVMNNIAEGFTRASKKENLRFYGISESSAAEVKSMIYVFEDLEFISSKKAVELRTEIEDIRFQTKKFMSYIKTQI